MCNREIHISTINERISLIIRKLGLTQAEIADKCGVSRSYFTNVVNGKATPNFAIIYGIAKHYKTINERWLLTGEGIMLKRQKLTESSKLEDKLEDLVKMLIDEIRSINHRLEELERKND